MNKHVWICLVLALFLLVACQSGDKVGEGLVLFQAFEDDGEPKDLVVVNIKGEEQHRIPMPDLVRSGFTTKSSHKALVDTGSGGYLVDAKEGTSQRLDFADDAYPMVAQFRLSGGGERWLLAGSPRGDLAYLVDVKTGRVHDMTTLSESAPLIFYGLFAPDEEHLVLGSGSELWLVPTANVGQARPLGTGKTSFASGFSRDGERLAYVQRAESDHFELVLESVDGSKSEVVATDAFIGWVVFSPQEDQLVYAGAETVSLLSLGDGEAQTVLSGLDYTRRPFFAPNGKKLLVGEESGDTIVWRLIDLKKREGQVLGDVEGYMAYFWSPDHRQLFFLDDLSFGKGGRHIASLHLESGEINPAMDVDEETSFVGLSDVARYGQFGLVTTTTDDKKWQLWLIRADGGEPRLLVESDGVQGAFSPDGQWVAVATLERQEGDVERQVQVRLMATEGDETRLLGDGLRPFWVRP